MYLGSFSPISCVCLWFEIWARERTFLRSSQNTQNTLFRISISSSSRAGKVFQFISNTLYCNLDVFFSTRKQNQSVLLIFFSSNHTHVTRWEVSMCIIWCIFTYTIFDTYIFFVNWVSCSICFLFFLFFLPFCLLCGWFRTIENGKSYSTP